MSPEDLELFRNKTAELLSSENPASKLFGSILNDAIDHIDSQAAQIMQHEGTIDLLQTELFELRKGKDAHEAISDLMAQISALKEMLVSMTTTAIWKASYDSLTGKYTISDADAEKMARQQLKAEMPGVEWG